LCAVDVDKDEDGVSEVRPNHDRPTTGEDRLDPRDGREQRCRIALEDTFTDVGDTVHGVESERAIGPTA